MLGVVLLLGFRCLGQGDASLLAVEAEDVVVQGTSTASVFDDAALSGGKGVRLERPSGKREPAEGETPALSLIFTKPERLPCVLWARLLAPNSGTDSLWIRQGNGELQQVSPVTGPDWTWQILWQSRSLETEISLELFPRESGLKLDRFIAVSDSLATPRGVAGELVTTFPKLEIPYPPPPILPPSEHPRVYLRREHLPMLRERAEHPVLAGEYERLKAIADNDWDGNFPNPKEPNGGNYHERFFSIIEANAFLYLLEEDEARGKRAVDLLPKALKTVVVADRHDVTRDYGRIIFSCAIVYDWCYPLADEAWRTAVLGEMIRYAKITEIGFPPRRQGAVTGHGSEAQLMREQLSAGIAVYDEYPDWYLFGAGRFFAEYVPARNMFFQAHRQHQGDSYGWSRFRWSMYAAFLMDRLGAGQVFDSAQSQIPYSWIYMRRGDGQFLRDGDTFSSGDYWMYPQGAMMVASYYREPTVNFAFRRMQKVRPGCVSPFWMILLYDPTVPVSDVADLPLSRYFPSPAGDIIARTGWQLGPWSNAVVAEMKGAFYHFNNHDHLDAGAFQIYYKGALATDAGCYGPYGTPYDRNWNKRSISHNTFLIYDPDKAQDALKHDGGQNFVLGGREPRVIEQVLKDYRDGETVAHGFGPDSQRPYYSYVRADLTRAYADRAEFVERDSLFLNRAGTSVPGVMVVFDRIVPKTPSFRGTWLIHSVKEPKLTDTTFDIRRTDGECNGRLLGTMLLPEPEKRRCETIGGPGREAEVFGHRFVPERPTLESQGWRLEISTTDTDREKRFLNVLQIMDAEPECEPLPVVRIEGSHFVGARIGDAMALFSTTTELIAGETVVPGGDGNLADWVVTGLKPGPWTVRKPDGVIVGVGIVPEDSTVLCFRASGAELRLVPGLDPGKPNLAQPPVPPSADIDVSVVLDGKPVPGIPPLKETDAGQSVALEPLAKALGYGISAEDVTTKLAFEECMVELSVGGKTVTIGGVPYSLSAPPGSSGGFTWVATQDLPLLLHCRQRLDPVTGVLKVTSPDSEFYWIYNAVSSAHENGRESRHALDGSMNSYWAANGNDQWLQLDLGAARRLSSVDLAWLHGDKRQAKFSVELSADGDTWTEVFSGQSSGNINEYETVPFAETGARFIRIIGQGNTANAWNSICEVRIRRVM